MTSFRSTRQPPRGKGQVDVDEDRERDQVHRLSDRERQGALAEARLESEVANPAAIISGPKRLSGRRHQAIRPLKI